MPGYSNPKKTSIHKSTCYAGSRSTLQNDAGTCRQDGHKIDTSGSGFVRDVARKNPGALAGATEVNTHRKTDCFRSLFTMIFALRTTREVHHG
ncbi:MAG TPA: hypothetical protein DIT67_06715 [Octadecabacter sp.]|nr:hypothetical protein [Octadecabacter sp.]